MPDTQPVPHAEERGGRPSKGTPKDGRLTSNKKGKGSGSKGSSKGSGKK